MNIRAFRQQYPMYDDLSDEQIADKLHKSFYSDKPKEFVYEKLGINKEPSSQSSSLSPSSLFNEYVSKRGSVARDIAGGIASNLTDTAKMIPDISKYVPAPLLNNAFPNWDLANKAVQKVAAADPYKMWGTEDKPWNTPGGAVQEIASLAGPGMLSKPLLELIGKTAKNSIRNTLISIAPNKYAQSVMNEISGGKSLEQHGQQFADKLKNTYEGVKKGLKNEYDEFFSKNNLGEKELYPERDVMEKGGRFPIKSEARYVRDIPDFKIEGASDQFDNALSQFKENPNIRNAQELRSELLSEARMRERQLNMARGKGESTTQQVEELKRIRGLTDKLDNKMNDIIGSKKDELSEINQKWKKNVVPYHGDTKLRDIITGRVTNPKKTDFKSIFQYADQDTKNILKHLGPTAENDILTQAIGIQPELAKSGNLSNKINSLLNSGFESYVSPQLREQAKILSKNSNLKGRLTSLGLKAAGITSIEEAIRRTLFD